MEINKITPNTPNKYIVGDYLKYYRLTDEHIVVVDDTFGKVFPKNADYETINNYIAQNFDISCYDFEDRGEYWEFIEVDEENCKYDYEPDEEDEKVDRYEEVRRIEGLIAKVIDDKEPQPFGDEYEIDIEYMEEENHNLFEAAVVLKYCNNPERYFPLKDIYNNISTVLQGEEDDILYHIADQIYTYYYGEEE